MKTLQGKMKIPNSEKQTYDAVYKDRVIYCLILRENFTVQKISSVSTSDVRIRITETLFYRNRDEY